MRKRFLSFVQQGGGRLCARPDQNDVNNYEKNEVRKVTNLHKAESESKPSLVLKARSQRLMPEAGA